MRIALVDLLFSWPRTAAPTWTSTTWRRPTGSATTQVVFVNDPHSWNAIHPDWRLRRLPVLGVSGARRDFTRKTLPRLIRRRSTCGARLRCS